MAITTDDIIALKARGLTRRQIAQQTGLSYNAVKKRLWRLRGNVIMDDASEVEQLRRENALLRAMIEEREEDDVFGHTIGTPFVIEGDGAIAGDIHCNTVNKGFMRRPLDIGLQYLERPRRFIVAGDLLNANAFGGYEPTYAEPSFAKEIKGAEAFFRAYLEVYDEIYIFPGNHDLRPTRKTHAAIDFHMIMKIISNDPRIKVSHIGHMLVNTSQGTYRVTHGSDYGINQLTVAEQMAHKYRQHIISHHEHHASVGMDRYKNWILVNGGGLFDSDSLAYTKIEDSKKANMANGFTMLLNGYPYLFTDKFTDWNFWLKGAKQGVKAA